MRSVALYVCVAMAALGVVTLALESEAREPSGAATTLSAAARKEIEAVEKEINKIEDDTLTGVQYRPLDAPRQVILLGKLLFYDRHLSVRRNEACAFCHMPKAGFSGPVSEINRITAAYPGSLRTRSNGRIPQTHGYASYSPVLHYNALRNDLVGGAFWDMRATGLRLNSPLAEQAQGPFVDPNEMAMIDAACVVFRASARPYRSMAERLWGAQAFSMRWPTDTQAICDRPGPAPKADPLPVHLAPVDRGTVQATYDKIAAAIAAYEGSNEVNSFSSKYDYAMAGKAKFTSEEDAGYQLFRSSASHCNECHREGGPGEEPLFTDFTASNLGLPPNYAMPYYKENQPDRFGYAANSLGAAFSDEGVGGFLQGKNSNREWTPMARSFIGRYKTATLRNVDKRPRPDFVKAYMHNGYLKSLKEVVHFYNTRDALPRCQPGDPGEKVSCWPAPERAETMNRRQLGSLGLTSKQEDQIVAFLKTLTDGYIAAAN